MTDSNYERAQVHTHIHWHRSSIFILWLNLTWLWPEKHPTKSNWPFWCYSIDRLHRCIWTCTHIWGCVDAVGVDHHWRGVGLQERTEALLNTFLFNNIRWKQKNTLYFTEERCKTLTPRKHTIGELWWWLTRLMFWYSMLSTSATDYHHGATAYTTWHTAQPWYWTILMYYTLLSPATVLIKTHSDSYCLYL